jgi:hypothetical protein
MVVNAYKDLKDSILENSSGHFFVDFFNIPLVTTFYAHYMVVNILGKYTNCMKSLVTLFLKTIFIPVFVLNILINVELSTSNILKILLRDNK